MKIILFIATFFLIISCNNQDQKTNNNLKTDSLNNNESIAKEYIKPKNAISFQFFWNQFKEATINNDSASLLNMTKFPLKARGFEDIDPQIDINKKNFLKVFNIFLKTDVNDLNIDIVKNTTDVTKTVGYNEADEMQRVGDMEFNKTGITWKLSLIYLDTKELKGKLKK